MGNRHERDVPAARNSGGKMKRKLNRPSHIILFLGAVSVALLVLLSPVFKIKNIIITGNNIVSGARILELAGIGEDTNILSIITFRAQSQIEEEPYIKLAVMKKVYPAEIQINVVERIPCAYIKPGGMNGYFLIDGDGMALQSDEYPREGLPVVAGLNTGNCGIGEYIEAEDSAAFDRVLILSRLLQKYEMAHVNKIDVTNYDDIHLYINNVDVLFGSFDEADRKLQSIKAIMEKLSPEDRGFLYIKDFKQDPWFERLK